MPGLRSVDAARFSMVPRSDVPRSAFDINHMHKTTFDAGVVIPVYVDEVLPGDSFRVRMSAFARLATPIVPMMDNLVLESFFFYVPNRLLWEHWERFMGEQDSPTDTTSFLIPRIDLVQADMGPGTLADYFGLTLNNSVNTLSVTALPFRAYNQIWNEWFRDQDLQVKAPVVIGDGPETGSASYGLLRRNKRHDYFTSARPWPQKPAQQTAGSGMEYAIRDGGWYVPPTGGAPVHGLGVAAAATPTALPVDVKESGGRLHTWDPYFTSGATALYMDTSTGGLFPNVRVLVNDIRTAVMVQSFLEKNSRGGTRYSEIVRTHFGVTSQDARFQRPEYLGGGRTQVTINPVAQTSASGGTGTTTKLGELAAIGSAMVNNHGFSQSFTEHGVILGLISIRSDLTYQQGVNRMWFRRTQFDFYWPALANLGAQAIESRELYCDGSVADRDVFGYQERWSEYKYKPSRTSGFFRSSDPTPLDMWHLGQLFAPRPVLNEGFIQDIPPVDRVAQVSQTAGQQFLADMLFEARVTRCMPMFSIPGVGVTL